MGGRSLSCCLSFQLLKVLGQTKMSYIVQPCSCPRQAVSMALTLPLPPARARAHTHTERDQGLQLFCRVNIRACLLGSAQKDANVEREAFLGKCNLGNSVPSEKLRLTSTLATSLCDARKTAEDEETSEVTCWEAAPCPASHR